jgi:hypothetical protein
VDIRHNKSHPFYNFNHNRKITIKYIVLIYSTDTFYFQDGQSSIVNFDSSFNGFGQQQQQQQIIVQQPQPQSHQAVYPESAPIIQPIHPPAAPPTPIEVDSNRALHQETKFPDDNRPKNSTQHEAGSGTHSNKTSSSSVRRAQARGVVVSSATTAIADNDDDEDDTTTITTTESLTTSTTATSTDSRCNNESLRMIIIDVSVPNIYQLIWCFL